MAAIPLGEDRHRPLVNEHDRNLLMLLGTVGKRISAIADSLLQDSLTCDDQLDFANQLVELADGFCHRAHHPPLPIEGESLS